MRCGVLIAAAFALVLPAAPRLHAQTIPDGMPVYKLDVVLDVARRSVQVKQHVLWTNLGPQPTDRLVFNAHSHYAIPDADIGLLAKTLELLRMAPSEAMSFDGPALRMESVRHRDEPIGFHFDEANPTALVVPLAAPVNPGETVQLELAYQLKLPNRKGRWGQWEDITTLAQWIPVAAVFGPKGWEPVPFIPWHQPFYNEVGHYHVRLKVAANQKVAASSPVRQQVLVEGWQELEFEPICLRDFAIICSHRFCEFTGEADGVKVRCLARPEHAHYGKVLVQTACDALPVYNRWFGRYPFPQFTIVESCFGWNGNECGGLVMIDERMMNMPHIAEGYPIYLLQHELCHQWWYNVVGTNGFAETFMDEGLATYFSHRLADEKLGRDNAILKYPQPLSWAPNITRSNLRSYGMIGARARGELQPPVQDLPKFGHLVNLTASTYDRGGKIIGLIEERLGAEAFLDLMRRIYAKYGFRILRVADFQRELEAYTGAPWDDFFRHYVHGTGMCDWAVTRVDIDDQPAWKSVFHKTRPGARKVVVTLKQQGSFNEPTVLGIQLPGDKGYSIRIPVHPALPILQLDEQTTRVECVSTVTSRETSAEARIELLLPAVPQQITVDPDKVLLDSAPANNHWKTNCRWHLSPLLSPLDEVDVTNDYDRWNFNVGPWLFFNSWNNPWFTQSPMLGLRAGGYRTQEFVGGAFIAYRSNDRNLLAGVDALWDHVPFPHTQLGLVAEHSLATLSSADFQTQRVAVYGRYVLMYGSSLYMPPFEYLDLFGVAQNRSLPSATVPQPDSDPFSRRTGVGLHYHKFLLTPYWDPEGGLALDATFQQGLPILGNQRYFEQLLGQVSFVKPMPNPLKFEGPLASWLEQTRWAFRLGGAAAFPNDGEFFTLGGGEQFRGFDLSQRQGNALWIGSVEWRIPVMKNLHVDLLDHITGVRGLYVVPFYDVGNMYLNNRATGPTAQALGLGLRVDVLWLGLIERTMLRLDVAKAINSDTPVQFWFGIQHPF